MGSSIGTILVSTGILLAVDWLKKWLADVNQDVGEVLCKENKVAMDPLDFVFMNPLLLLLEHGNRCMEVKKKTNNSKGPRSAIT